MDCVAVPVGTGVGERVGVTRVGWGAEKSRNGISIEGNWMRPEPVQEANKAVRKNNERNLRSDLCMVYGAGVMVVKGCGNVMGVRVTVGCGTGVGIISPHPL